MKRSVRIVFALSLLFFMVTLFNSFVDFNWISFEIGFVKDIEILTFVINHILVIYLFITGIKEIIKSRKLSYLIIIFLPLGWLAFSWYLFFVRIFVELFS